MDILKTKTIWLDRSYEQHFFHIFAVPTPVKKKVVNKLRNHLLEFESKQ